ncbi:MAG: patatin-like phospholipase family protein [Polyangiales bacterium]
MTRPRTGLVLTGGGARAAYQVGALLALREQLGEAFCFDILAGASAGAINSTTLASYADDFGAGLAQLRATWSALTPDRVYRTDVGSLLTLGTRWMRQLSTGGLLGGPSANALLDTAPLGDLLRELLPTERIAGHVASGKLYGAAVTATSYHSGSALTFFDGAQEIHPWARSTRLGVRHPISVEHVLASAAIPLFFPPISIEGSWFGDGCLRLNAPLSPAIHLGAERIVAIGIRYARTPSETDRLNRASAHAAPSVSEIGGVLLNAIFLDSLEADVERMMRINATLTLLSETQHARQLLRRIPLLVLRPSRDLGKLAIEQYQRFPKMLRYLLRGIGASGESGWDLVSYLAFEPGYIARLFELGYDDTRMRRADVEAFFAGTTC